MVTDITEDAVLNGRLKLRQPKRGHRVGHDAILLAAACPARAGEHAVEFGAGVGAAALALAARVERLKVTLTEIDGDLCRLAGENAELNGLAARVDVQKLDVGDAAALAALSPADRVLMNPPFNDPARAQVSPDAAKRRAHVGGLETLSLWADAAAQILKPHGTLTLIWRGDALDEVRKALARGFGDLSIILVHPKPDASPIRVLVSATKGAPAGETFLKALELNDGHGKPSPAAEAILRAGETLPGAEIEGSESRP